MQATTYLVGMFQLLFIVLHDNKFLYYYQFTAKKLNHKKVLIGLYCGRYRIKKKKKCNNPIKTNFNAVTLIFDNQIVANFW